MSSLSLPDQAEHIMQLAVDLAMRGKGRTAPNPCVGAVVTRGDRVVAQGYHRGPGLPHAEVEAIAEARALNVDTRECTLWVTLEPCNHQGRTPPCTMAVLEAGIPRVVIGTEDPNPAVCGGVDFLRSRGVEVHTGVARQACRDLIADFTTWVRTDRPYVYLKLAATLDGRIATRTGDSRWISGEESRAAVHALRGLVGAVLVGARTFAADNPRLTCRTMEAEQAGARPQPLAVVAGTRLPDASKDFFLLRQRPGQTIFWTTNQAAAGPQAEALRSLGCRVWGLGEDRVNMGLALVRLRGELGIYNVLCEGGGRLAGNLVQRGLVGEWWLFQAPRSLGDEQAVPVLSGQVAPRMDQAGQWRFTRIRRSGEDLLVILRPGEPGTDDGGRKTEDG